MRLLITVIAFGGVLAAQDGPRGVPARPSATDYAASTKWQNATFAASLVPAKQVEHMFAFDISKSYVVFEVACYADSSADLKLAREAFVVKVNASGEAVHNAEPGVVASAIQRQNLPPMPSSHGVNVATAAAIGVEHGTDPYSGRPATHVYTAGEVGVETGRDRTPPQDARPGGTSEDRRMLEAQLQARSLPEGPVHHPVAGYIFFRKSDLKTQPDDTYALQYLADQDGSGATHSVTLSVPKKAR